MEPNSLELGYGRTGNATTDKDKDANEHYLHLVEKMAISFEDIKTFDIKCNDPFATYMKLSERVEKIIDKNIIIVPLNNKISTVGVAITAIKNDNIQICYAPALVYNYLNYSTPGEYCYIFSISEKLSGN
jgi:ribosomal protein RSM22 (predicted rRNA methylase)